MPDLEPIKVKVEKSEVEAFCKTLDILQEKLKGVDSTFERSSFNQPVTNNKSTFASLAAAGFLGGAATRSGVSRAAITRIGVGLGARAGVGAILGGPIGLAIGIVAPFVIEAIIEEFNKAGEEALNKSEFNFSKNRKVAERQRAELRKQREDTIATLPDEVIVEILFEVGKDSGVDIKLEDLLNQLPDLKVFFTPDDFERINSALEKLRTAQEAAEEAAKKLNQTGSEGNEINKESIKVLDENSQSLMDVGDAQSTNAKANKDSIKQAKALDKEILKNKDSLNGIEVAYADTNNAASDFGTGGLIDVAKGAKEAEKALSDIDLSKLLNEFTPEQISQFFNIPVEDIKERASQLGEGFEEGTKVAKQELTGLSVFASDIAANINDTFADLLFNAFKGNFENIGELWSATLDSMLEALSQFAATAITNPIRIGIESVFNNLIPSGPIGVKDGDDPGITNLLGGGLGGGAATILSKIGLFAKDTIPLIGTIINAVIAVAATAISLIKGLFEKKPRLDIDLDQIRDDAGKRVGEIAKVADFLDEDLVDNIINVSVKRKAGLGGIGDSGIKKQIKDAIQTQIADIQDIINTLPADIASSLNELLLSTEVDTESLVKGDRLLEFDESKKISEKFQQFINGDLQARFLFSIRDFFVGAFESLGVLGSAAQDFIDAEFENFQGLSREERIEAGQEFLQDFQTLTDAFNVLNNNGADSIGATVNSIKNLSNSLEFDGVPSIEELDAGLEELIGEEYLMAA